MVTFRITKNSVVKIQNLVVNHKSQLVKSNSGTPSIKMEV